MQAQQFRVYIVNPALRFIDAWSAAAEELIMLTAAQESRLGYYVHQLDGGPASGALEMEPQTHDSLWANYLNFRPDLAQRLRLLASYRYAGSIIPASEMNGNLLYAVAMARVKYKTIAAPLPHVDDIQGMAGYYKAHYNTAGGKATIQQAVRNYHHYVEGK